MKNGTEEAEGAPVPLQCFRETPLPTWYEVTDLKTVATCYDVDDRKWTTVPVLYIIADYHSANRRYYAYLSARDFPIVEMNGKLSLYHKDKQ